MPASDDSSDSIYFGSENALAASLFSADDQPGMDRWLPLILYGDSGSGKSCVALSLASRLPTTDDGPPILTTAADLARLFQPSRLATELESESQKCRTTSLLVVDDVDQLRDRKHASCWLVGILDRRYATGLPSIVTTKSMASLRGLSNRLFSRLTGGLPVRCVLPDAQTRRTIIQNTIQSSASFTEAAIQSLVDRTAGMSVSGIRNVVLSNDSSLACDADAHHVICGDFPLRCQKAAARRFGIRVADIKGPSRRKNTVMARSIAMFLIREFTSLSLVDTGQCFQKRDHTTVRHACQKIRKLLLTDQHVQDAVRSICVSLNLNYDSRWSMLMDGKCA